MLASLHTLEDGRYFRRKPLGQFISNWKDKINYYFFLHMIYIVLVILIASGIMKGLESNMDYIDCFFLSTSAMCESGLVPVDISAINTRTQVLIFFLFILGNPIVLSLSPNVYKVFFVIFPQIRRLQRENTEDAKKDAAFLRLQLVAHSYIIAVVLLYCILIVLVVTCIFLTFGLDSRYDYIIHSSSDRDYNNFWFATFHAVAAFANAGIGLLPDNYIQFQKLFGWLFLNAFLILAGNTAFPIFLRFVFAGLRIAFPHDTALKLIWYKSRLLYYLLYSNWDCFKLLLILLAINAIQWGISLGLEYDGQILAGLNGWQKVYNEMFQAISTRTAGFNSVNLGLATEAVLILYIGCMFLSAFPIAVSMRDSGNIHGTAVSETRKLLLDDLSVVFIGILVIEIIERNNIRDFTADFNTLKIVFEVVSGYGGVGLSLGYKSYPVSLSAGFNAGSKVVMCIVMILGRHRGLPCSGDPAVVGTLASYHRTAFEEGGDVEMDLPRSERHDLERENVVP